MKSPKRLFIDIEVSPNIGLFWQPGRKISIDYGNIIEERSIICICYKWQGQKTSSLTWDKNHSDKDMLKRFIRIANEADEIVFHNGDKFDLPWIRARCLYHGLDVFPSYTTIDTLKIARSRFRFNSNRLDYIAKFLGIGSKIKTEFDLWKDVLLKNSPKALKKMTDYCKGDVELLEKVFKKMSNHIPPKTHNGVILGGDRTDCPECGSPTMTISKTRVSAAGTKKIQYQCQDCGKYHTCTSRKS